MVDENAKNKIVNKNIHVNSKEYFFLSNEDFRVQ